MTHRDPHSRRRFMTRGISLLVAAPVVGAGMRYAAAQAQVDLNDPTAKALAYVHDASTSEARSDTAALCSNCQLYTGEAGSEWGPCALFPGKVVAANGWCSAYVKKA